jgi:hypothetical protein
MTRRYIEDVKPQDVEPRAQRQAVNESLMREVNERVADLDRNAAGKWGNLGGLFEFVCECSRPECDQHVRMTLAEYDQVRSQDDRFALVPGHETDTIERIVVRRDRYVVVDKADSLEPYVADDPRGAPDH